MIFEYMRYDFLITITASVIRASALAAIGLPEPRWRTGSDFHFMARICKFTKANYISIPTFIKHEYAADGALPKLGHVVTGKSALSFIRDWQIAWEDLFWNTRGQDPELRALRSLRHCWMAEVALRAGERELTLDYLRQARAGLPRFWRAIGLYWLVRCLPGANVAQKIYRAMGKVASVYGRLRYAVAAP
jgi:hypothetical protein